MGAGMIRRSLACAPPVARAANLREASHRRRFGALRRRRSEDERCYLTGRGFGQAIDALHSERLRETPITYVLAQVAFAPLRAIAQLQECFGRPRQVEAQWNALFTLNHFLRAGRSQGVDVGMSLTIAVERLREQRSVLPGIGMFLPAHSRERLFDI
jgi:hypothetical protein